MHISTFPVAISCGTIQLLSCLLFDVKKQYGFRHADLVIVIAWLAMYILSIVMPSVKTILGRLFRGRGFMREQYPCPSKSMPRPFEDPNFN